MHTRAIRFVLFMALSASALGCPKKFSDGTGSGSSDADASAPWTGTSAGLASAPVKPAVLDVCALIPVATVASTTGVAVNGTDPMNDSGIPNCSYRASGKLPRIVIQKSLSTLGGVKSLWPGGRDVPGVGDAAYLTPHASELDIQKGKTVIRVAYESAPPQPSDDAKLEVLKKLAGLALPVLAN